MVGKKVCYLKYCIRVIITAVSTFISPLLFLFFFKEFFCCYVWLSFKSAVCNQEQVLMAPIRQISCEIDECNFRYNFSPLCTTFDIVHDMTCLDLFCKGQFVLNFSGGMPLSDSLSTFFFDSNCYCMTVLHVLPITYQIDEHASMSIPSSFYVIFTLLRSEFFKTFKNNQNFR